MGYGVTDFFTTSPAERLRNQYSNLVSKLDTQITSLEKRYNETRTTIHDGMQKLGTTCTKTEGVVPELFYERVSTNTEELQKIVAEMESAIRELKNKRSLAKNRYETLKWYCKNEDNREKEYKYHEIIL